MIMTKQVKKTFLIFIKIISFFTISFIVFKINIPVKKDFSYLEKMLEISIKEKAWPGGVLIAGDENKILINESFGFHTYDKKTKVEIDDIFDLASLTKVVATTTMAMKLYDENKLNLNNKIYKYYKSFCQSSDLNQSIWKKEVKIEDLLAHCSGLGNRRLYEIPGGPKKILASTLKTNLSYIPETEFIYSDINFIILEQVLEKISKTKFDNYLYSEIFSKLRMNKTFFNPDEKYKSQILPTEFSETYNGYLQGIVHDKTARALNGVAGHAGLFSTGPDLSKLCKMLLNNGILNNERFLSAGTIKTFTKKLKFFKKSSRRLGWDSPSDESSGGIHLSSSSFGHTGYTGTSLWIDPENNLYVILLTNSVHPNRSYKNNYSEWRQKIHSTVYEVLGFKAKNKKLQLKERWDSLSFKIKEKFIFLL